MTEKEIDKSTQDKKQAIDNSKIFTYRPFKIVSNLLDERKIKHIKDSNVVFIIDIDPDNDQITNELTNTKIKNILNDFFSKENKILIITSNSHFEVVYEYVVNRIGLKVGYLIGNGGATAYDIHKKKMLFQVELGAAEKKMITHVAQMHSIFALASATKHDYVICSNYLLIKKFIEHSYVPRQSTDDYQKFENYILYNKVSSVLCYESNDTELEKKYEIFQNLEEQWNINVSNINNHWFIVTPKGYNKMNAVYTILDMLHHTDLNNVYYLALNSFDPALWWFAKDNHLMSNDCMIINKSFFSSSIKYEDNFFYSDHLTEVIGDILNPHSSADNSKIMLNTARGQAGKDKRNKQTVSLINRIKLRRTLRRKNRKNKKDK